MAGATVAGANFGSPLMSVHCVFNRHGLTEEQPLAEVNDRGEIEIMKLNSISTLNQNPTPLVLRKII